MIVIVVRNGMDRGNAIATVIVSMMVTTVVIRRVIAIMIVRIIAAAIVGVTLPTSG